MGCACRCQQIAEARVSPRDLARCRSSQSLGHMNGIPIFTSAPDALTQAEMIVHAFAEQGRQVKANKFNRSTLAVWLRSSSICLVMLPFAFEGLQGNNYLAQAHIGLNTSRAGKAGGRTFPKYKNYSFLSPSFLDSFAPSFFLASFLSFLPPFFPSF